MNRSTRATYARKEKEEEGEDSSPLLQSAAPQQSSPKPDVVFDFGFNLSPKETIRSVAEVTAFGASWVFWLGFAVAAYFHESYFSHVAILLGVWYVLQIVAGILDDDFKNNLFWSIVSMIGHLVGYLLVGSFYSISKLWWEISNGHLNPIVIEQIRQCKLISNTTTAAVTCTGPIFTENGWLMMRWMTTWPVSLVHTILDNPIQTLATLIYTSLRMRYIRVMFSAIEILDAKIVGGETTSWSTVAIYFAYIFGYFAIGYAWIHIKLFIDVWQGALPPSLDKQVKDAYERKIGYWEFVKQIKWHATQWMLIWPVSIFYTLLRHPFRIIVDLVYDLSIRKFTWIVEKAMFWRMKKD